MVEEKKKEIVREILVMTEMPKQEVRMLTDKDGKEYEVISIEEALSEIVNNIRIIKKSVA